MRILLIEDEIALSDALCHSIRKENITVVAKYDGESGYYEASTNTYDAIILDWMLPKMNGIEILQKLRTQKNNVPILLLTAKSSVESKISGLDAGADYYLTKPFEFSELMACIRAILRRPYPLSDNLFSYGDISIDHKRCEIHCKTTNKSVKLGMKELNILEFLIRNKGQIILKERLKERVWGFDHDSEYNNVEVYISFLRKKLQFIGSSVQIKTTRGVGYSVEDMT